MATVAWQEILKGGGQRQQSSQNSGMFQSLSNICSFFTKMQIQRGEDRYSIMSPQLNTPLGVSEHNLVCPFLSLEQKFMERHPNIFVT